MFIQRFSVKNCKLRKWEDKPKIFLRDASLFSVRRVNNVKGKIKNV